MPFEASVRKSLTTTALHHFALYYHCLLNGHEGVVWGKRLYTHSYNDLIYFHLDSNKLQKRAFTRESESETAEYSKHLYKSIIWSACANGRNKK